MLRLGKHGKGISSEHKEVTKSYLKPQLPYYQLNRCDKSRNECFVVFISQQ